MKRFFSTLFILAVTVLFGHTTQAEDWRASLADMPLSATQDEAGNMKGAYVELIRAIDKLAGTKTEIAIAPFQRSLHNLSTNSADYHIPLIEIPGSGTKNLPYRFSTVTLFQVAFVLYTNKNMPIDINRLGDFQIGTDRAHTSFFPFKILGLSCLPCGIKMVNVGHLDGFIFAQNEIDPFITEHNLSNIHRQLYKNFDVKIVLPKSAAGRKIDSVFSHYIQELRKTGEYDQIMAPVISPYRNWQPHQMTN